MIWLMLNILCRVLVWLLINWWNVLFMNKIVFVGLMVMDGRFVVLCLGDVLIMFCICYRNRFLVILVMKIFSWLCCIVIWFWVVLRFLVCVWSCRIIDWGLVKIWENKLDVILIWSFLVICLVGLFIWRIWVFWLVRNVIDGLVLINVDRDCFVIVWLMCDCSCIKNSL